MQNRCRTLMPRCPVTHLWLWGRCTTAADIRLVADVDEAYGQMSGLATREVLRRQFEVFGDARFERLATISNGHVYNPRRAAASVQSAACGAGRNRPRWPSACVRRQSPTASRASYASTPCTRVTAAASRNSI